MPKDPETHYRGQRIRGHSVGLRGRLNQQVKVDNLDIGDTVQMLVTGSVTDMGHRWDDTLGGLVRKPVITASEAHMLDEGEGDQLLLEMRERDAVLLDQMLGRTNLFADPDTGEIPPPGGGPESGE